MDFECLTGGLSHANRTIYSGSKLTFNTENIFIDAKSNGGGITTNKTIDLANFKNIKNSKLETKETTLEIDISSLNDSYYIINGFNQSKGNIYEIWLEK